MRKKLTSFLLAAALVASAMPMPPAAARAEDPAVTALNEQLDGHFKKGDTITLLVALNEDQSHRGQTSVPVERRTEPDQMAPQMAYAQAAREDLFARLDRAGIAYKVQETYDMAFTGVALEVKVGDARKVAALEGVNWVEASLLRQAPTLSRPQMAQRQDLSSNKMVGADQAQANDYNGEGALIAVIDSGCDPNHEAMSPVNASTAHFKNAQEVQACIQKNKLANGAYFSSKIPFGYNYANRSTGIKEDGVDMSHGMHVAGIIAGNSDKLRGIAPEAQLAIMRVFGGGLFGNGTNAELYTKALEDAIKMDVDSVNISIGSPAGAESNVAPVTTEALQNAQRMGIVVSIAAGNNGFYGKDAGKDQLPSADNPDYGLLADPAVAPYSMAVASVQNMQVASKGLRIVNDARTLHYQPNAVGKLATGHIPIVDAGYGHTEEFPAKPAPGTYALVQRGSAAPNEQFDFSAKINNAEKAGYAGVIIFDNEVNAPLFIIEAPGTKIPAVLINNMDGLYLQEKIRETAGKALVCFDQDFVFADQPGGGELSDFSSWGMTPAGNLKPDISAPGGGIFSAYNDSQYGNMDGTSMAAPHVAGGLALVKQRVEKDFPDVKGAAKYQLVKNLLMSTAAPHKSTETNAYTSPRQQGAGLMQVNRALEADAVIEGTGGVSSINIGTDLKTNDVTVPFTIRNYGTKPLTYRVYGVLNTDSVKDGKMVLTPRFLAASEKEEVTVAAGGQAQLTISLAVPEDIDLPAEMANGYFLEGFVFAESSDPSQPSLGAPFVGFHGSYRDLNILEPSIYDLAETAKRPYYYDMGEEKDAFYTHIGAKIGNEDVVLGQLAGSSKANPRFDREKIAFSPNGDGAAEKAYFYGTFLRNFTGLELTVREGDADGRVIRQMKNLDDRGVKNFFIHPNMGFMPAQNMTTSKDHWAWDGTDGMGGSLPDGRYDLAVQTWGEGMDLNGPGQTLHFPLILDRVYPRVTKAAFNADRTRYTISEVVEDGSGLRDVYIQVGDKTLLPEKDGNAYVFDLAGLDQDKAEVVVRDHAYNTVKMPLDKAGRTGNERSLIVNGTAGDKALPQGAFKWQVQTPDGQPEDTQNLPVGQHILVITDIDAQYRLIGSAQIPFEITEADLQKTLTVAFEAVKTNDVIIDVDNATPSAVSLVIEDLDHDRTFEPRAINSTQYRIGLPEGRYRISLNGLDDKYMALVPDGETFEVRGSRGVTKTLKISEKKVKTLPVTIKRKGYEGSFTLKMVGQDLMKTEQRIDFAAGESEKEVRLSFVPSDLSLTLMEDGHYTIGRPTQWKALPSATQLEVTLSPIEGLAPGYIDRTALRQAVEKAREVSANRQAYEPDPTPWKYIDMYLPMAEQVLIKEDTTQEEVDKVCKNLLEGLNNLRKLGASHYDLSGLQALVDRCDSLTPADYTADSWQALEGPLTEAKAMLAKGDGERNQGDIDLCKDALEQALGNLVRQDGKALADTSALEEVVAACADLDEFAYTAESWANLQKALDRAQDLLDQGFPDAQAMAEAVEAITRAREGLVSTDEAEKPVQKEALKAAVESGQARVEGDYTPESWEPFAQALARAKAVLADDKADQGQVDVAWAQLKAAADHLQAKSVDSDRSQAIRALTDLLARADQYREEGYSPETWQPFAEKRQAAKALLADSEATSEALEAMTQDLDGAIKTLVPLADEPPAPSPADLWDAMVRQLPAADQVTLADGDRVKAVQEAYDQLGEEDRAAVKEEAAFKACQAAYQALVDRQAVDRVLKAVSQLPASDKITKADRQQVAQARAAYQALTAAQKALVSDEQLAPLIQAEKALKAPEAAPTVDKKALKRALDAYQTIDPDRYTPASFDRYLDAYLAAKAVFNRSDADQAAVDRALADLEAAKDKLVRQRLIQSGGSGGGGGTIYAPPKPATKPLAQAKTEPEKKRDQTPSQASRPAKVQSALKMAGYPDGSFRPDATMSRAEVAALLARLLPAGGQPSFKDVPADAWYAQAVASLQGAQLLGGYSDGTFRGDRQMTRAEFVALVAKWQKLAPVTDQQFQDVPATHWASPAIGAAVKAGWITGVAADQFAPEAPLTRAEAVTILNRVLKVSTQEARLAQPVFTDVQPGHWAYAEIMSAHA
ncbi:S8 family serine peptidase [Peptococcus simiae]|uniref:S8 family serine peptidase n=1 Tax=Peptococcus simiae TaxID=1643805 RepID=A0ABW9GX44_9FIRM